MKFLAAPMIASAIMSQRMIPCSNLISWTRFASSVKESAQGRHTSIDIDENGVDPLIAQNELERLDHCLLRGLPTPIKEISTLPTVM